MLEATTDPALRAIAADAHRSRSLAAWRLILATREFLARAVRAPAWPGNGKRAAPKSGPSKCVACSA